MKKLFLIAALLLAGVLGFGNAAFSMGTGSGDGTYYAMNQETAVFLNNSGETMSAGQVVILDSTGTAGSTLGSYVTLTSSADSILVVGVVKSTSSLTGTPVVVVTKGPIDTQCADSGDAVTTVTAVGASPVGAGGSTTNGKGLCGGGTNLGIALEAGDGTDSGKLFVWVSPTGAD